MKTSATRMVSFWILVLIVITGCVSTTGAYNYVMTPSQVTYIPDEYYYYSSTQWEEEYATASASSGGASCTAETFAQGNSGAMPRRAQPHSPRLLKNGSGMVLRGLHPADHCSGTMLVTAIHR